MLRCANVLSEIVGMSIIVHHKELETILVSCGLISRKFAPLSMLDGKGVTGEHIIWPCHQFQLLDCAPSLISKHRRRVFSRRFHRSIIVPALRFSLAAVHNINRSATSIWQALSAPSCPTNDTVSKSSVSLVLLLVQRQTRCLLRQWVSEILIRLGFWM